jgi:predicted nucleic acid-binding protein
LEKGKVKSPALQNRGRAPKIVIRFAARATLPVWVEAGRRFARDAKRRRRSAGHGAKRLLADFIIGSHALVHADRFMTLDPKRYARDFPELRLL